MVLITKVRNLFIKNKNYILGISGHLITFLVQVPALVVDFIEKDSSKFSLRFCLLFWIGLAAFDSIQKNIYREKCLFFLDREKQKKDLYVLENYVLNILDLLDEKTLNKLGIKIEKLKK